jgi:hypothetical protein
MTIGTDSMAMNFPFFLKESEIQAFYRSLIRVVLENNAPRVL